MLERLYRASLQEYTCRDSVRGISQRYPAVEVRFPLIRLYSPHL